MCEAQLIDKRGRQSWSSKRVGAVGRKLLQEAVDKAVITGSVYWVNCYYSDIILQVGFALPQPWSVSMLSGSLCYLLKLVMQPTIRTYYVKHSGLSAPSLQTVSEVSSVLPLAYLLQSPLCFACLLPVASEG